MPTIYGTTLATSGFGGYFLVTTGLGGESSPTPTPTPTSTTTDIAPESFLAVPVVAGLGSLAIWRSPGRLISVLVTAAGTGSGNVVFYDSKTAASGTIVGLVPATVSPGTFYVFDFPVAIGIWVANPANGPALTVGIR
jgi:hypothetical protein